MFSSRERVAHKDSPKHTAHVLVLWHDLHRLSERTTPRMIKERAARLAGKLMQDPR